MTVGQTYLLAIVAYVVQVYVASFFPLAINVFVVMYLQCISEEKMASWISLLRGLILNCTLLYLLPLILQSAGIWWAIFGAKYAVGILSVIYLSVMYNRYHCSLLQ